MGQISLRPPNRNITQLKNLILAGEFFVKVEIGEGEHWALLALKRPLGDINAEEGGEIHYWGLLEAPWEDLGGLLGPFWRPFWDLLGAEIGPSSVQEAPGSRQEAPRSLPDRTR